MRSTIRQPIFDTYVTLDRAGMFLGLVHFQLFILIGKETVKGCAESTIRINERF